jgi:hypothetical protein
MEQLLLPSYLVFELPFIGALMYVFLMASGFVFEGHDVDLDHDLGHDFDLHHGVDVDGEHGEVHEVGHEPSSLMKALSFLGFGKVPVSIVMVSFCFLWGFSGFASNQILGSMFPGWVYVWPSLLVAICVSFVGTSTIARMIARIMPSTETYSVSNTELVGQLADVRFAVSAIGGTITLYDRLGTYRELSARTSIEGERIPPGTRVVIVRHDKTKNAFVVAVSQLPERLPV